VVCVCVLAASGTRCCALFKNQGVLEVQNQLTPLLHHAASAGLNQDWLQPSRSTDALQRLPAGRECLVSARNRWSRVLLLLGVRVGRHLCYART
jgi:hypothetical protein